ncbi:MAG TPA: hypothetical protein VHP99_10040 [Pyrinomonadaceae bacterium]|nr:hypothetical protein [Pyrinomonadaceae bacterium]
MSSKQQNQISRETGRIHREPGRPRCGFLPPAAYCLLPTLILLLTAHCSQLTAQTIPDKIVASVTNGSQATPDVITYSDLVWQLALEPGRPSPARPSAEDLKQALDTMVQQTLVLQEAKKLPLAQTSDVQKDFDKKVKDRLDDVIRAFGSRALLEERMKLVGLTSEQLDQILRDRQTMDSYVDFRFRAFAVVSTKEISDRYEKLYGPQRGSGRIVKTLDQARDEIERDLTEEKIQAEIDNFIDRLVDQPGTEIVILNPV